MNDNLTKREREVLELIAAGLTDEEISKELGITLNTANTHRKAILSKFGAKNVAVLIRTVMRKGLIK